MCLFSRVLLVLAGESRVESWSVHADGMNMMKCPACNTPLKRNGKTSSGSQRWRCKECGRSKVGKIDNSAKELNRFLSWLLSRQRQKDMPGAGRTFRRRNTKFWQIWPFSPIVDEVHDVVFVDGIHLTRLYPAPFLDLFPNRRLENYSSRRSKLPEPTANMTSCLHLRVIRVFCE